MQAITAGEPSSAGTGRDFHRAVARIAGLDGAFLARLNININTQSTASSQTNTRPRQQWNLCTTWCGVVLEAGSNPGAPVAGGRCKNRIQLSSALDPHSHASAQLLEVHILENNTPIRGNSARFCKCMLRHRVAIGDRRRRRVGNRGRLGARGRSRSQHQHF